MTLAMGCAGGADPDSPFGSPAAPGGTPTENVTTSGGGESTSTGVEEMTTTGEVEGEGTTTGSLDDGTTGPASDESTGEMGEESSGDDGPMSTCNDGGVCASAMSIGTVSGDLASTDLQISGAHPDWITFRVTEDDDDIDGAAMSFTVSLASPGGTDFDLYVYRSVEGGTSGCGGFLQQSTNLAGLDAVSMNWGEALLANGVDDSVWVAVEIVEKTDSCMPPSEWTLSVQGDT